MKKRDKGRPGRRSRNMGKEEKKQGDLKVLSATPPPLLLS
jgi:hypothetical protein